MVRNYKLKTERTKISEENVRNAVNEIIKDKASVRETSSKYNIPKSTLFNRLKKIRENKTDTVKNNFQSKYTSQQIFTAEQEILLCDYLISCSQLNYGLTYLNTRKFAFQYAYHLKIPFPDTWSENKMAGVDWMKGFMQRQPELSLRKPEKTSIARASAFNVENVKAFMDNYEAIMKKYQFTPDNIYNLDETGVSTVMEPPKVIARCGQKQVAHAVSAERGQLVTICCIINAIGNTIPPVFVFPRHKYKDYFLKGCPPGSKGCATPSGWMTGDTFLETIKHFQKHFKSSKDNPVLIILDNHETHATLEVILYCRENGIVLLTFPPHTSHRLQPLDITVFGPFKLHVKSAFNDWMMNNPGKRISMYDIPEIVNLAYNAAFTMKNILNGFKFTGIWPFNKNIFDENDFLASKVSVQPQTDATSITENGSHSEMTNEDIQEPVTPESIRPYPKLLRKGEIKRGGRKPGKSRILTSSPEKNRIQDLAYQRKQKRKQIIKKIAVPAKKVKSRTRIDLGSESEENIDLNLDSEYKLDNESDKYEKMKLFDPLNDDVQINDFILVKFFSGNSTASKPIHYIGKIDAIEKEEVVASFLRRRNKSWNFIFPEIEDVSAVDINNIVLKLPPPTTGPGTSTRSYTTLNFCVDLQGYDVR